MQVIESARIAWKPAVVKRIRPRLVQALLRATAVLVAIPVVVELAAKLGGGAPALRAAADASQGAFGIAGLCLLAALVFVRGFASDIGVAVDKRSFFVGTREKQRRIPRWQVDSAIVRPPDRRRIEVRLGTGEIFHIRMRDDAEARSLAAILAAAPRRRASDDD